VAIRYEREGPTEPWRVTGLVASDRRSGIDSRWMKRFRWRGLGNPLAAAVILWQSEPAADDLEEVFDEGGEFIGHEAVAQRHLPQIPATDSEALYQAFRTDPEVRIRAEDSDRKHFYERVTRVYLTASGVSGKPVEAVAEEFGVPRTTAVNWVREARVRGYLPPAQRGKAT
jgi:hypothetical protein